MQSGAAMPPGRWGSNDVRDNRTFFPFSSIGVGIATLLMTSAFTLGAAAQATGTAQPKDTAAGQQSTVTITSDPATPAKGSKKKDEKVVQSKDTKKELKKVKK